MKKDNATLLLTERHTTNRFRKCRDDSLRDVWLVTTSQTSRKTCVFCCTSNNELLCRLMRSSYASAKGVSNGARNNGCT